MLIFCLKWRFFVFFWWLMSNIYISYFVRYLMLICLKKDILYACRTNKHIKKGEKKMLEIMMISSFALLGAYSIWYFFKAKTYHPLTLDELALMWKNHKQTTNCNAAHIDTLLVKKNEIVGYKCSCGTKYYQKRLITQRAHNFTKDKLMPKVTMKISNIPELSYSMKQVGLNFSQIKRV